MRVSKNKNISIHPDPCINVVCCTVIVVVALAAIHFSGKMFKEYGMQNCGPSHPLACKLWGLGEAMEVVAFGGSLTAFFWLIAGKI